MATPQSSILAYCNQFSDSLELGIDFTQNFRHALNLTRERNYLVIVAEAKDANIDELKLLFAHMLQRAQALQIILIDQMSDFNALFPLLNDFQIFKMIDSVNPVLIANDLVSAIEQAQLIRQQQDLENIVRVQGTHLQDLTKELEQRVEKRQQFLESSRETLLETNQKVEALHKALVAIHRSINVVEMEQRLTEALADAFSLQSIKVLFKQQNLLKKKYLSGRHSVSVFSTQLLTEFDQIGEVIFTRELTQPFLRHEKDFLRKVADAIALAIDRLIKLEELENLGKQWETTFNAISHPLSLIDSNYTIVQANSAYAKQTQYDVADLRGRKCFQALFNSDSPCQNCKLGSTFDLQLKETRSTYFTEFRVQSFAIKLQSIGKTYFQIYQDQKQNKALERRMVQNSKLVELGTIGGSIAHELNNPIGGILNYIQLILMDITPQHPLFDDIKQMEDGAIRCKEIVQNLLSFTRKPDVKEKESLEMLQLIETAAKLTELQTRSLGIEIRIKAKYRGLQFFGHKGLLIQAIRNILQNAFEAIEQKRLATPNYQGLIEMTLDRQGDEILLFVEDDGIGIDPMDLRRVLDPLFTRKNPNEHSGLGLTLSYQIIAEHSGDLSVQIRQQLGGTLVKVSLPAGSS